MYNVQFLLNSVHAQASKECFILQCNVLGLTFCSLCDEWSAGKITHEFNQLYFDWLDDRKAKSYIFSNKIQFKNIYKIGIFISKMMAIIA